MGVIPVHCKDVCVSFIFVVRKSRCHSCSLLDSMGVTNVRCSEVWVSTLFVVGKFGCHS